MANHPGPLAFRPAGRRGSHAVVEDTGNDAQVCSFTTDEDAARYGEVFARAGNWTDLNHKVRFAKDLEYAPPVAMAGFIAWLMDTEQLRGPVGIVGLLEAPWRWWPEWCEYREMAPPCPLCGGRPRVLGVPGGKSPDAVAVMCASKTCKAGGARAKGDTLSAALIAWGFMLNELRSQPEAST